MQALYNKGALTAPFVEYFIKQRKHGPDCRYLLSAWTHAEHVADGVAQFTTVQSIEMEVFYPFFSEYFNLVHSNVSAYKITGSLVVGIKAVEHFV